MVTVQNLTMRYGNRVLFENINLKLDRHKRYGLIGANGAGKTTFLKILCGQINEYDGEVIIPKTNKVGVLGQNQYAFEEFTIMDAVLYGNKRLYDAIKEKEIIYATGDFEDDAVNDRLAELEVICVEEDPTYEYDVNIAKILENVGIPANQHNDLMSTLDSADKFKVLLAQVLYPKPDVLFLDEPTNNQDIETITWLENELQRHEGTMVVISHDRHFLNAVVTNILDVDYQKIREFTGNFNDWYIAANVISKQNELNNAKQEKEKEQLEAFVRRFSANASKAKQATSRQKQLDKLVIDDIKPSSRRDPSIVFKAKRAMGDEALNITNINHSFGDNQVLKDISLKFIPDEKVALIGPNGVGKTTLMKIMMEEMKPTSGEIHWGATIENSYFPQDTADIIKGDGTLYDWLKSFNPKGDMAEVRNCLGRMLFNGEQQEKSVVSISGGEKHRMMLSKMMLEGGNFVLLDEPSNHLDLEAIVALGEALYNFKGNVICVSHDRELLDAFANRIIELHADGSYTDFKGTYEEFVEAKASGHL
ncbi:ABC-F family ATP-binding cassette domain-containing protein [Candidatus Sulfurimonas baltica]|uniref:Probable ATP-binding protein YbiT n=1 Tax=Candidatus Sulfurimonas baltica TaxID=2740404 RepID=A0A7S7RNM6_9BACT|nr:ATP-binding cassette domain-containing protein [Candidatus Sulfurimonas baltica]QOY52603.1 ATP-binding cassette domain-containing protein [Candidatus Sulfurimonas baltica]